MKIRLKVAIVTFLIGVLILLASIILAKIIIIQGFVSVENFNIIRNVQRVNDALTEKIQTMDATTHDYATWDASYYAVTGENTQYDTTDFVTLENLNLDFAVLMRNDGKIMLARDMFSGEQKDYNATNSGLNAKDLYSYLEAHYTSIICTNELSHFNGLLQLPIGIALISSRPVLKNDGTGPIQGTLIFGKMIDESFVEKLSNQTHLSFSFQTYTSISYETKLKLNALFSNDNTKGGIVNDDNNSIEVIQVLPIDEQTISGNVILKDIFRKPAALLEVNDSRTIYLEGQHAVRYIIQAMIAAVILFIAAGYFLFNRMILSRVISMERQMREIHNKKLASFRLTLTGKDELSSLGESVNAALDVIEKATEEKQAVFDADPDTYFYVDSSWKIIDYKLTETLGNIVSKKNTDKLKTLSLSDLFNSAIMNKLSKARSESVKNSKPVILEFDLSIDGAQKIFEARVVAVNSDSNNNMCLILLRDITDRKKFEQQLLVKNKDLEKFNKFAIDRELRMDELKKEMHNLRQNKEK